MRYETVNDLLGAVEKRIKELGKLKTDDLRYELPELAEGNAEGMRYGLQTARLMTKGMTREDMIAEIIVEEFSTEYPMLIGS